MSDKVQKWKELSRETVFEKYGRGMEKVMFELPDGTESDFYIKKEGPTVCIVALTKDRQVIMAKQFRPGPQEVIIELPGGGIEKGETPQQAIERELLEETGYRCKAELAAKAFDCAYSTRIRHCFVATNCEKVAEPQNSSVEICEVVLLSLEEFREHLRSGKLTDTGVGYIGLDHLNLL